MGTRRLSILVSLFFFTVVSAAPAAPKIPWSYGPCIGHLGTMADINVPKGFMFVGQDAAKDVLTLSENIPTGKELGVLYLPAEKKQGETKEGETWFVIFEFAPIGFVKDDEKDTLDADAILAGLKKGTEQANEERRTKGWSTLSITDWVRKPFYDSRTHNLTWALGAQDDKTHEEVINNSVRILGRDGVMTANLVLAKDLGDQGISHFDQVLTGFHYTGGKSYAEFKTGDKVATIGLTALIAGGVGAVLVKSGLLAKMWKLVVVAVIAAFGFVKRLFTGKKSDTLQG